MDGERSQDYSGNQKRFSYCPFCGAKLDAGARYCKNCGEAVGLNQQEYQERSQTSSFGGNSSERKTTYEGHMHKCPNCGAVLPSFTVVCPHCGYEVRDASASNSIREFVSLLATAQNNGQKCSLIRSFPIPNAKEDILEFMILASTNFNLEQSTSHGRIRSNISDAWLTKLEQGYQKAKLLISDDEDFAHIQDIYNRAFSQIKEAEQRARINNIIALGLQTIGLWSGLFLFIVAFFLDVESSLNETAVFHLGGGIAMILGSFMVMKKSNDLREAGVGVICGIAALLLGTLLNEVFWPSNGTMMIMSGGATIIISAYRALKSSL